VLSCASFNTYMINQYYVFKLNVIRSALRVIQFIESHSASRLTNIAVIAPLTGLQSRVWPREYIKIRQ
jgi:hypothetical protein